MHELQSMLIQEETRLKKPIIHSANLLSLKGVRKKLGKKNGKGNQEQLKINQSFAPIHKKEQIKDQVSFLQQARCQTPKTQNEHPWRFECDQGYHKG